jgi:hypothetical protein
MLLTGGLRNLPQIQLSMKILCRRRTEGETYDFVILDVMLPDIIALVFAGERLFLCNKRAPN